MHAPLKHTSLKRQFELRQKAFKPNMDIQLTPPYLVDGVLTGAYVPPDEDNCIEMECFDLPAWQEFFLIIAALIMTTIARATAEGI